MSTANKWIALIVILLVVNMAGFGFYKAVVKAAKQGVLNELRTPYSPSPYGPGLDPDKVNFDAFRKKVAITDRAGESFVYETQSPEVWRTYWEDQRTTPSR